MTKREGNPNQIIRQDGKNVFADFTNDCFQIGKLHIKFAQYDTRRAEGDRFVNMVDIYVDFAEWLALANQAIRGQMHAQMQSWKDAVRQINEACGGKPSEEEKKRMQPILFYERLGGTAADTLARRDQARTDGMSVSRLFRIFSGNRGYLLSAQSGPGEQRGTGIIVPRYSQPEHKVTVAVTANDLDRIFSITYSHIQGYITSQYQSAYQTQSGTVG